VPDPDALLAALDDEQRHVALAPVGPVLVRAGAGTGKTRAITHRIAYLTASGRIDPAQVLAVTFTTRAAGELVTRLRGLGAGSVQARTFHSAALRQLRHFWPQVVGGPPPDVTPTKARLLVDATRLCRLTTDQATIRDLAAEVEWAKVTQTAPDAYAAAASAAGRRPPIDPADVARVLAAYEDVKERAGRIDFEDVLLLTVGLLDSEPRIAAEVRSRYRFITVDEYQDVNPLQQRLLDAWLGTNRAITVVGDPQQTIYSFAGASPSYLTTFASRHPDAVRVDLVRNYRSTPQVVALANRMTSSRPAGPGAREAVTLVAQRDEGRRPALHSSVDEVAEATSVAVRISRQHDAGTPWREIAVLFRINAQSEAYEQALAAAGIPYTLKGGERFFDRPEVRQAVVLLRGAARAAIASVDPLPVQVSAVLSGAGWTPDPPQGSGAVRERWESLAAVVALAEEVAAAPGDDPRDLARFVVELDQRAAVQHAPVADGVTLATMHAAKGLEWSCVHVVGLADGTMPLIHATTQEQIDEERRLLYVAITRARDELDLSWSRARSAGARASREPSRFLYELAPALEGASGMASPERPGERSRARRGRAARCRVCGADLVDAAARSLGRCPDCPSSYDEELLAALKVWRLETSREAAVPAYVVFTDATLIAIAEALPSDRAQLLSIPGVGTTKVERFGDAVLDVVARHV
jgi:DNA helicase-2/ATP-dependent DNA helicase PcrA